MTQELPREVRLSEKQVVFGVMAVSVVVVVAFLCGVFVGRGVQALRPVALDAAAQPVEPATDVGSPAAEVDQAPPVSDQRAGPVPPPDHLTYPGRLGGPEPGPETLPQPPADASADAAGAPGEAPGRPGRGATPVASDPGPGSLTVQVAAVRRRAEAQAIVDRLTKKGYPAYVYTPTPGDRTGGFRVRVGFYKSRQEAEAMVSRLKKEEKYDPWITR